MTRKMEDLAEALSINQVPGRNPFHKASWEKKDREISRAEIDQFRN